MTSYKFGSVEESIAISVINRRRTIKATEALFSVVAPDKFNQLFKSYRGLIFPEEKYDDLAYIKRARAVFEKMRNIDLRIMPIKGSGADVRAKSKNISPANTDGGIIKASIRGRKPKVER